MGYRKQKEEIKIVKDLLAKNNDVMLNAIHNMAWDDSGHPKKEVVDFCEEILCKIEERQTNKSSIAKNMKCIIRSMLLILFVLIIMTILASLVVLFIKIADKQIGKSIKMGLILLGEICIFPLIKLLYKEVDSLNKSDAYNMCMFLITLIALGITIAG